MHFFSFCPCGVITSASTQADYICSALHSHTGTPCSIQQNTMSCLSSFSIICLSHFAAHTHTHTCRQHTHTHPLCVTHTAYSLFAKRLEAMGLKLWLCDGFSSASLMRLQQQHVSTSSTLHQINCHGFFVASPGPLWSRWSGSCAGG